MEAREEASVLLPGFLDMEKTSREEAGSAAPQDKAVKITGRDRSAAWPTESKKEGKMITPKIVQLRLEIPADAVRQRNQSFGLV